MTHTVANLVTSLKGHLPLIRGTAWVTLGELASKLAVLIATVGAARILAPQDFAVYISFVAIALLAAGVADAGISQLIVREVASGRTNANSALFHILKLKAKLLPAWILVFGISVSFLPQSRAGVALLIAGYGLASILATIHMPLMGILRGEHRFATAAASQALGRWISAIGIVAAVFVPALRVHAPTAVMGATAIGELSIVLAASAALVKGNFSIGGTVGATEITIRNALPFAANTILAIAYNRMDIVVVAALTSANELSRYVPASRVQDALYIVPTVVTTVALPFFARTEHAEWRGMHNRVLSRAIVFSGLCATLPVVIAVWLATPHLLTLLFGSDFLASVGPTRVLIWSIPFGVMNAVLLSELSAGPRPAYTTWVFVAAFTTSLVMHAMLDAKYGATGAAWASLSRDPVAVLVSVYLVHRSRHLVRVLS